MQTLAKLDKYCNLDIVTLTDITYGWIERWEADMARTCKVNSRRIHLSNLRTVMTYAGKQKLIEPGDNPSLGFSIRTVPTQPRALTVEELRRLRDYPCEEHQRYYRDLFMLMFYLRGINAVDLFSARTLDPAGRLVFDRSKTGYHFSMRVEPEALAIIERYRGKEFLLNVCDRYANYKDFLHRMNLNLQRIGAVEVGKQGKKTRAPLWPRLTTYWARHTFASLADDLDISKETIAKMLGHDKRQGDVTAIYIKRNERKADAATRRVIDYVNSTEIIDPYRDIEDDL